MKPGTPFFVANRLKEAREARGLSVAALAEVVDVRRETIYQIEAGRITPGPALFAQLQQTLRLPTSFFIDAGPGAPSDEHVLFRSLKSATKPARQRALRRLQWLERLTVFVEEVVELPEFDVPDYDLPKNPINISDEDIDAIADDLRKRWALGRGPISNVAWLMENHGIIIAREDLDANELDAAWLQRPRRIFVLLGADKAVNVRSRLDAAHELGHTVLHRQCPAPTNERDPAQKVMEGQAFRFAGSFLLPAETFTQDVWSPKLDDLRILKQKWLVSIAAMIKRMHHLNLVSDDAASRLWKQYGSRGWNKGEPFDDEWPVEQPVLLRRSFEMMLDAGVVSPDRILNDLHLAATDIETLAGLPNGTISHGPVPLAFRSSEADGHASANNVVPFHRQAL